jgi:hydroxyacylglutathione hydrolase
LIRIGYEQLSGRLDGGLEGWRREGRLVRSTPTVSVAALAEQLEAEHRPIVVDVRHENEWRSGHIAGSLHLPLPELEAEAGQRLPRTDPLAVHCAASYRSGMAVSLLERLGYEHVFHVLGGFDAWRAAGQAVGRPLVAVG